MALYRGIKSHATRLADRFRAELSLGALDRFLPFEAAKRHGISVCSLSDYAGTVLSEEHFLALRDSGVFSAVTVFRGDSAERRIIYNDAHTPERAASDLAHELSHAMLEHPARQPLDALTGCRFVHRDHEEQAAYLSGALLITERGAIQARLERNCARGHGQAPRRIRRDVAIPDQHDGSAPPNRQGVKAES